MTISTPITLATRAESCVIALHCSLSSGRQWAPLAAALGGDHQVLTPDLPGYGSGAPTSDLPLTLAQEVALLGETLDAATRPIHLVGHSYGGAVAFKIATDPRWAGRVRSLTLLEPVLPALLLESSADARLHERFVLVGNRVSDELWTGVPWDAVETFLGFWRGSGPAETLSTDARLRMIEHADRLAFDFACVLAEKNVAAAAAAIDMPTLLFSGGLSPYLTQRIVGRLASLIRGAQAKHLPGAGHMLPISHAATINPDIVRHIAWADESASGLVALDGTARSI
jgi:pimeloyl-ACP methyl ester carboxylesterase